MSNTPSPAAPPRTPSAQRHAEESKEDSGLRLNHTPTPKNLETTTSPPPDKTLYWTLYSWKSLKIDQQPLYDNQKLLSECLSKLKTLPPIVHESEIETLKFQIAQVTSWHGFAMCSEHAPRLYWTRDSCGRGVGWIRLERVGSSSCRLGIVQSGLWIALGIVLRVSVVGWWQGAWLDA